MSLDATMPHYIAGDLKVRGRNVDFVPAFIADGDTAAIAAARNKSFFENDDGAGQIVNGQLVYWQSKEEVLAAIVEQIALSRNEFTFDPSSPGAPVNAAGDVKELDRFFVKTAGSWGGMDLVPGDILVAVNDVPTGTAPTAADFVKNEGASQAVNEASTALAGTVFLSEDTIALDSSEQHTNRLATRKAIADTFIAVRSALLAQMAADKAELDGKIGQNTSNISDLGNRVATAEGKITATEEKNVEQDTKIAAAEQDIDDLETRVDSLEEYKTEVITLQIGNGADVLTETVIPGFDLENVKSYAANWAMTDGNGGYRPIQPVNMEIVQSGADNVVRAAIVPAAATNEFQVTIVARCKPKA